MQIEVEYVHKVIWNAKKPVMTIKPMAGRVSPFVGLNLYGIRYGLCDMVTIGLTPEEAEEDIEIHLHWRAVLLSWRAEAVPIKLKL